MTSVVIVGGGPGGYEAALVGTQLGAKVTLVDSDGIGGSAVLTDCVPSKTLIAAADLMGEVGRALDMGMVLRDEHQPVGKLGTDLGNINARVKSLATQQSSDIEARLVASGVTLVKGHGRLAAAEVSGNPVPAVIATAADGTETRIEADAVLLATGAAPRTLPSAMPDGERILTWEQVYELDETPEHVIVVGSGVTGLEFANAYLNLGIPVTLISSRDRVLPGEDADAARVLEDVVTRQGMTVLSRSRMESVVRDGDTVTVTLSDGKTVTGSHVILALGSIPNTADLGLDEIGVETDEGGFIAVDRVSRTSVRGVYSAGDCTGVFMLASVAAMQGRIAMWHLLGDAVNPLDVSKVSSNVFTSPEIATVGTTQQQVDDGTARAEIITLPLATNPRAKMKGISDGFVKLFATGSGRVVGGVVVGPNASELIHPISIAIQARMSADELAQAFTVYPSLSGSVAEAARRLHHF